MNDFPVQDALKLNQLPSRPTQLSKKPWQAIQKIRQKQLHVHGQAAATVAMLGRRAALVLMPMIIQTY
ncbi:hypothetical protein GGI64_006083 [Rhizobium leguminosarum]|uniref:Uncharacterized protein n=1 Tax=Rhizobium leguminosarum TaxID=384 RepID=A0A7Z0J1Q4_RHILE|nr:MULTISPECIES: hypothetical protein [Rhizobium]KPH10450.1 hypothetical protein AOG23_02810 [Rhizobium acidisoli]NYJ14978.1 hypothetical protein [Rhizobium leguminosarum]